MVNPTGSEMNAKPVLVIGAGLAGLSCAFYLAQRGREVVLLEARPRVGGRVITVRDWAGEMLAEGGAEFIDTHHRHVLRWARHFGLEVALLDQWPNLEKSADEERFWNSLNALSRQLPSAKKLWPFPPQLEALDQVSMVDWWDRLELDRATRQTLDTWCRGVEGVAPDRLSILSLIVEERQRHPQVVRAGLTLKQGMDALPHALSRACLKMGVRLHTSAAVNRVERRAGGVTVATSESVYEGRRAVICLPATVLSRLTFHPTLSQAKVEAIEQAGYGALTKTLLEFEQRFWPGAGVGRLLQLWGDELNSVWESTRHPERAILVAWSTGATARRLSQMSHQQRLEWTVQALEKKMPGAQRHFVKGHSFDWTGDPYSRGGYSHSRLGYLTTRAQALSQAEGPLHFAGEHTSPFNGYMEGALESGLRAAREILTGDG